MEQAGKTSTITGFKDPSIATSIPIIDLLDALRPGKINYEIVLPGANDEVISHYYYYYYRIWLQLSLFVIVALCIGQNV